jgi:hypothetical protein
MKAVDKMSKAYMSIGGDKNYTPIFFGKYNYSTEITW